MKISPNLRVFFAGKTQSGKSHLCKALIGSVRNRIIYDVKREYSNLGLIVNNLNSFISAISRGIFQIVIQPDNLNVEEFDAFCEIIYKYCRGVLFVVDEVHMFASKHYIPRYFQLIITTRQSYSVGVWSISQRPANVHNDIISQASLIICFRMNLPTDAEAIYKIPAETIMTLKQFHFAVFDDRLFENAVSIHEPI